MVSHLFCPLPLPSFGWACHFFCFARWSRELQAPGDDVDVDADADGGAVGAMLVAGHRLNSIDKTKCTWCHAGGLSPREF